MAGVSPGVQVWRIDNISQQISTELKNKHGIFKGEDSYIVLETKIDFKSGGDKAYTLYYWLGSATTQEEFAIQKCTDLKDKLGEGVTGPKKELQEAESAEFKALFPISLKYLKPVVLQAQVNLRDAEYPTKLYHLKGKKDIRVKQMPVSVSSLNAGDVFLLDNNTIIYQWMGKSCNRMEKGKALDMTTRMRDERMNRVKAQVILIDEGNETPEFWEALGGKGEINQVSGDDEEWEKIGFNDHHIYRINAKFGDKTYTVEEVDTKDQCFVTSMLDPNFAFIIDFTQEMFVWYGRFSAMIAKTSAVSEAKKIARDSGRPETIQVTQVEQGVEPAILKCRFKGYWVWKSETTASTSTAVKSPPASPAPVSKAPIDFINVDQMHHPEKYALLREDLRKTVPMSDIENVVEREFSIWYIKDNEKYELPQEEYGVFYSGDSYVILFSVRLENYERFHVIYYWQGRDSSVDDQGTAALLATNIAQSSRRRGSQLIRVPQGHETTDFLSHFEGYASIREGKRETWEAENRTKSCLYDVRGHSKFHVFGVQVGAGAFSLNSSNSFTLFTENTIYCWNGKGSNEFERKFCVSMSNKFAQGRNVVSFEEGSETAAFWEALGGKGRYCNRPEIQKEGGLHAKFFYCTDKTGTFVVSEIKDFSQDNLESKSVVILDVGYNVFVWISSDASDRATRRVKSLVREYVSTLEDGRSNTPIVLVEQGKEIIDFTLYFHGWQYNETAKMRKYSKKPLISVETLRTEVPLRTGTELPLVAEEAAESPEEKKNSAAWAAGFKDLNPDNLVVAWERLQIKPPPKGVDGTRLEAYLSEEEFTTKFKMTPVEFYKHPKWKQVTIRKSVGIF
eukprot:TRINITY_DN4742_c0_g1_i1.p1 TRINITY_DN4742_c0_g1~~TRINITY_DN4742_c0_g1_i1.p1  ORF type:complete len:860 (+),score=208.65 TRINITY_DN4742_c0_g1_i1:38-2581(+)